MINETVCGDSSGIPPNLLKRLHKTLKKCRQFKSNDALRRIFTDQRINPWCDELTETNNLDERVEAVITCFHDRFDLHGENVLVLLLKVLSEGINSNDTLHHEIVTLASEVENLFRKDESLLSTDEPTQPGFSTNISQKPHDVIPTTKETSVDFVIVTPLEEERDAVLAKLPGYRKLDPVPDDSYVYYQADLALTSGKGAYRLIVMLLVGMGRVQAATATAAAIRRWDPRYVILVGIGGGVGAKGVNPGDVLVPDKIVDYALQKQTFEATEIRWEVYNVSAGLLAAAQNFTDGSWLSLVKTQRPQEGAPKRHIGPIASGDVVINFIEVLNKYRETWSKLVGVEMEAGGVALSAFQAEKQAKFFMVRGVSDLADGTKDKPDIKAWRVYACDVAAAYTVGLLQSGPVVPARHILIPETVFIPAGEFWMGSEAGDPLAFDNETPHRKLTLPAYAIGKYPITNAEYLAFVNATGYRYPEHWLNNGQIPPGKGTHPVVNVSLKDAQEYCHWLTKKTGVTYRLPTEEEWEKAARGAYPEMRRYPWPGDWDSTFANTKTGGPGDITPVNAFESRNLSLFGIVDMAGNVWEWTTTSYKGERYIIRGGSFRYEARFARNSCRGRCEAEKRDPDLSFRIIQALGG